MQEHEVAMMIIHVIQKIQIYTFFSLAFVKIWKRNADFEFSYQVDKGLLAPIIRFN